MATRTRPTLLERPARAAARPAAAADPLDRVARLAVPLGLLLVLFLAFYNLADYPQTWFDEGEHLGVGKTLVRYGVYAEHSSDGFRYYGPTTSVGPTVLLALAGAFKLLGVGLVQGRLVMASYLVATVMAFYLLARQLGGPRLALVATAVLVPSQGVGLLEFGRQALGEVPGLCYLLVGLLLWFKAWERAGWGRLALVGLLFGLASITKHQFALVLAPTLGLAWLANLVYYRLAPQRLFLVPGIVTGATILAWQACMLTSLGPSTLADNLALVRESVGAAAFVFSPDLVLRGLRQLLSPRVYLSALPLGLAFGLAQALPRRPESQRWGFLMLLALVNLGWFVVASVGWLRYAFPALVVGGLLIARAWQVWTDGYRPGAPAGAPPWRPALRWLLLAWLGVMVALPLGQSLRQIVRPAPNAPLEMAAYLDQHVSPTALIESFEPELSFLTDHRHHTPPVTWLYQAVKFIWQGGSSPGERYDFLQTQAPDYLIVGKFGRWVGMYPPDLVADRYAPVTAIGEYELFVRRDPAR